MGNGAKTCLEQIAELSLIVSINASKSSYLHSVSSCAARATRDVFFPTGIRKSQSVSIYVPSSGPPPPPPPLSPPPWSWFSLPPCGWWCCRYCMVAPPPLWMWVPPVDVSPVRSVWFAPLPLWMWVLFAPYTK